MILILNSLSFYDYLIYITSFIPNINEVNGKIQDNAVFILTLMYLLAFILLLNCKPWTKNVYHLVLKVQKFFTTISQRYFIGLPSK